MITRLLFMLMFTTSWFLSGQNFGGLIVVEDKETAYLNQIFVTNLNRHKTVLADPTGKFTIPVQIGDIVRFTSIVTERKDIKITEKHLIEQNNIVPLSLYYYNIGDVFIKPFKPTKNIQKDVLALKVKDKISPIKRAVGLPEPKIDPETALAGDAPAAFAGGGLTLNIEAIYDIISGEKKKKQRLRKYNIMQNGLNEVKQYFGTAYFKTMGIPEHLIDNFLQFVYSSENIQGYIEQKNYEALKIPMDKYLPIYQNRLKNSKLLDMQLH